MTAVPEFTRLESLGWWRKTRNSPAREIVVNLGESTLTLFNKNDVTLAHWSLQTVRRVESAEGEALYSPDSQGRETVQITDATMIAALARLSAAAESVPAPPKRSRPILPIAAVILLVAILGGVGASMLPELLAGMVRSEKRGEVGNRLLLSLAPEWGRPCTAKDGRAVLIRLGNRLFGDERPDIRVVTGTLNALRIPGGVIIVGRSLLESEDSPEPVAGYIFREWLTAQASDPLADFFRVAGPVASARIVLGQDIEDAEFRQVALAYAGGGPADIPPEDYLKLFRAAGFPSTPFARSLDEKDDLFYALVDDDPFRRASYRPLMNDGDWLTLQSLCEYGSLPDQSLNKPN